MNKLLGGVFGLLLMVASNAQATINDLFISEYVEGSGYNKAIELYNGASHSIDLSEYQLVFYLNGSKEQNFSVGLSGILTSNTTYVVANTLAASEILLVTDKTHDGMWFNGDDVVVLTHKEQIIDSFGQVGIKPGNYWGNGLLSSKNRTLRRIAEVATPDIDVYDDVDFSRQWNGYEQDSFDGLGTFIKYSARACSGNRETMWYCGP